MLKLLRSITVVLFLVIFGLSSSIFSQKPINDLKPTVILISIDGFRADFIDLYSPPTIKALAENGTRALYMKPPFPTKTFPAHYSIATGLYPDNHGIIENNIYDSETKVVFGLSRREEVMNPMWWGGEPVWNTAQKQGQIAGAFFWPGAETNIGGMQPKFWQTYDGTVTNFKRVDTVLGWLDLPRAERPTMITLYFSDVDDAGHNHGPESPETKAAVMTVDGAIERLVSGLADRGLEKTANLIIVSDHGMAPYKQRDAIVLDTMFDTNLAERIFWTGEFVQIFPKSGVETEDIIYDSIKKKLPSNANIYRRKEIPKRFNFGKNKRIAPIVVIPNEGTTLTTRERTVTAANNGRLDNVRGAHGYDNDLVSMRATFVGHGQAFKQGFVSEPFESVDVYELICKILKIKPAKNDGKFKRIKEVLD